jgi:hypothetical protein
VGRVLALGLEQFAKGKLKALTTKQSSAGAKRRRMEDSRLDDGFVAFVNRQAKLADNLLIAASATNGNSNFVFLVADRNCPIVRTSPRSSIDWNRRATGGP